MAKTSLSKIQKIKSLKDLAELVGYKPKQLSYILYVVPDNKKYIEFTIPKKNGGERVINAPIKGLKHLQRRLAWHLNNCFDSIYSKENFNKTLSHGYRRKHSTLTNAARHRGKRYVFNIDLKDFFPSLNFGRVQGFFINNSNFELPPKVATIMAQISCHDRSLPQGAPTSPVISNFIGHILDIKMVQLAKKAKCSYSRYVDDLTFSTNDKIFPDLIAKELDDGNWCASNTLVKLIESVGFQVNPDKISMAFRAKRQVVTGLVVNKKVNVKREYYKHARSMCHSLFTTGEYYLSSEMVHSPRSNEIENNRITGNLNQLNGTLNYIYHVKKTETNRVYQNPHKYKETESLIAIKKLYSRFLYYNYFHAIQKTLIITEGKTDVIYLKCALRRLFKSYPSLLEKKGNYFNFNIDLFSKPKAFMECCSIAEGTTGLVRLMHNYEGTIKSFHDGGKHYPVILLVDNDSGANTVFAKLGEDDRTKPFYHFKENLYVVATPISKKVKQSKIEDFFPSKILKKKLSGKTFNPDDKKFDREKEYSKIKFAEHVVQKNEDSIDFKDFKGILDRIVMVNNDYAERLTGKVK